MKFLKTILLVLLFLTCKQSFAQNYFMEELDRGLVAIHKGGSNVFLSWRMLGTDPEDVSFNVYRNDVLINTEAITTSTNYEFTAESRSSSDTYKVEAIVSGVPMDTSKAVQAWSNFYKTIATTPPPGGTTPSGGLYTYSANDASAADLDGDGELEIVLKWTPSNAQDNANGGYTGSTILEGLEMDGTSLWRIDLGINIRAGAHYTQFMVYDLDSDGKAEVACKTADGSKDSKGKVIGDAEADYRSESGYILEGPEFLTIFNGETGAEIVTTNYYPARGNVSDWGDSYGNRVDRFLACIAYLDGERPSLVMCRGYYTRTALAAYDFRDGELTSRWIFDTGHGSNPYKGQGNHNLSVGDVDNDGKDEIMYGACAIDDNGEGLYTTGYGHGDAGHLADIDPDEGGLEYFMPHEHATEVIPGMSIRNAATGEMQWTVPALGDIGRGVAMDIDPNYRGYEVWASDGSGVHDKDGNVITTTYPISTGGGWTYNFGIWWDTDLQREYFDRGVINKWNPDNYNSDRLLTLYNIEGGTANNGSKSNPCLQADLLGDWREEIILRNPSSTALIIYMNDQVTTHRIRTLLHDRQYRLAVAWQNVGYNQPPHTSFYLGDGMKTPPRPNIRLAKNCLNELKSLPFGQYSKTELADMDVSIDDISSLYLPIGSSITMFENDDFTGESVIIDGTDACSIDQPEGTYNALIYSELPLIEEVDYIIRPKLSANYLLSVEDASAGIEDFIVFAQEDEATNQSWTLKKYLGQDQTFFTFKVAQTGYLMEISSNLFAIQGEASTGLPTDEQLFEIESNLFDPSYFMIKNKSTDSCLTMDSGSLGVVCKPCSYENDRQMFSREIYAGASNVLQNVSENAGILCYPNPFCDYIRFELEGQKEVNILTLSGRSVFKKELDTATKLDLSFLEKGIYLVNIKGVNENRTIKMVKQ